MVSRVHHSWLGPLERPALLWIAARLPKQMKPDHLTVIGVIGAIVCGLAYAATRFSPEFLWLANAGLLINWFGDSLDGTLARFRKIERPRYGFFVDHTTDVISQLAIVFGLGASPYLRFDVACLALIAYWIAALFTFIRALASQVFQISYRGVGPTEVRIILLGYNMYLVIVGPSSFETGFGVLTPLDGFVVLAFVAVIVSFLVMAWSESRRLAAEDGPSP